VLGFLFVFVSFPFLFSANSKEREPKYLYWGSRIDCPGKCCDECAGLGHQESSLRCALEEALVLNRFFLSISVKEERLLVCCYHYFEFVNLWFLLDRLTLNLFFRIFVMPSRMCLSKIHNTKGILHTSNSTSSDERSVQLALNLFLFSI
jgi:hypothetical protein